MKLFYLFGLSLALAPNVSAYIDPSVATYAIQAGAGVVIAVGTFIGLYWRKAKRKVMQTLDIDENAKKEVEEELEIYEEEK
ncbi:MAG: hypothetical protein R3Y07_07760 [Eubacteriales bacterium]